MAYPTVIEPCLTDNHNDCPRYENTPPRDSDIIGGGFCVCPCHGNHSWDHPFYLDVLNRIRSQRKENLAE